MINALSIAVLIPMIVSDARHRTVSVWWLIAFGVIQILLGDFNDLAINSLALIVMFCGNWLWLRFRHGNHVKFDQFIGLGDIVFLFCLAPSFEVAEFVVFLVISMVLSLLWWILWGRGKTIPLVTTLGLCYILYLFYEKILLPACFLNNY